MLVRSKGESTSKRPLPGGGPQGGLLGGVLFLVMINDCGFKDIYKNIGDTITNPKKHKPPTVTHENYVDDLTLGEKINLKDTLKKTQTCPIQMIFMTEQGIAYPLKSPRCISNFQISMNMQNKMK